MRRSELEEKISKLYFISDELVLAIHQIQESRNLPARPGGETYR